MTKSVSNRILRVYLEEAVGSETPPDLQARILDAINRSSQKSSLSDSDGSAEFISESLSSPKLEVVRSEASPETASKAAVATSSTKRRSRMLPLWLGSAAAGLLIGVYLGSTFWSATSGPLQPLASSGGSGSNSNTKLEPPPEVASELTPASKTGRERPPFEEWKDNQVAQSQIQVKPSESTQTAEPLIQAPEFSRVVSAESEATKNAKDAVALRRELDSEFEKIWVSRSIAHSKTIDLAAWRSAATRILFGDLNDPSGESYIAGGVRNRLDKTKSPEEFLDIVFADETLTKHFRAVWGVKLADFWLRDAVPNNRAWMNRVALQNFVSKSLGSGESLDKIVFELLSSSGASNSESTPVTFWSAFQSPNQVRATSAIGGLFLDSMSACAQCHDRPGSGMSQREFWGLNAHLRQLQLVTDAEGDVFHVTDSDFGGEGNNFDDAAIFFEDSQLMLRSAYPVYHTEIANPRSGRVEDFNRRLALAHGISNDSRLAPSLARQVWELITNQPVGDGLGPLPSEQQDILNRLGDLLVQRSFKLEPFVADILVTEYFTRQFTIGDQSVANSSITNPLHLEGKLAGRSNFSAEEVLRMMVDAWQNPSADEAVIGAKRLVLTGVQSTKGSAGSLAEQDILPETLRSPNDPWQTSDSTEKILQSLLDSEMSDMHIVEHLFLLEFSRPPSRSELARCESLLKRGDTPSKRLLVLQDIWWSLRHGKN